MSHSRYPKDKISQRSIVQTGANIVYDKLTLPSNKGVSGLVEFDSLLTHLLHYIFPLLFLLFVD